MSVTIASRHSFKKVASSAYCDEYQAVYDAMTDKPTTAHANAQNAFVESAIENGYWSKFDRFWFFANDYNDDESLLNWKNPTGEKVTNTTTAPWTTLQGFTGDGSNYLATNFNISTDSSNFTQNDASVGFYSRTSGRTAADYVIGDGDNTISMIPSHTDGVMYGKLNSSSSIYGYAVGDSNGLFILCRADSSNVRFYRNGSLLGSRSGASSAVPDSELYILANAAGYSYLQISMAFIGGNLTDDQVSDLNTDFETLMDALGTGVE